MTSLLPVPMALWEAPLDVAEIILLAVSKTQREMTSAHEHEARQFRELRSLPFYDEAAQ